MWELDYKESWAPRNWCFWTVLLEKSLESPMDCKEVKLIHPKRNLSWIFIGRTDFLYHGLVGSPCSPRDSQETSPMPQFKTVLQRSAFFMVQLSHPYMTTGKTIALTRWTFVGKIMSLLFNMLSRLIIAFLPRSKCLLISGLQSAYSGFGIQENKIWHCFHCFHLFVMKWWDWMPWS